MKVPAENLIIIGMFKKDQFHGQGKLFKNGQVLEGKFKQGKFIG